MKKIINNYKMLLILCLSIIIGIILGLILNDTSMLTPFKDIFLNALYTLVVPLVFIGISSSIANMSSLKRLGKILKYTFIIFIITSLISSIFMLFGISVIDLSSNIILSESNIENISLASKIVNMFTVNDFTQLFSRTNMMPLIIAAILFGFAISLVKKEVPTLIKVLNELDIVMMKIVKVVMYYAPIGLCAYFACLVNEYGVEVVGSYAKCMIFYFVMCILYFLIFYTLYAYIANGKRGIKTFYKNIFPSVITSFATSSSLATLPTNITTTKNMNIDSDVSEVSLSLGSTMHMEGSSMASILKIAFLFSLFDIPFTGFSTIFKAILVALLSSIVMSGIPGGGLIGEALIVSLYGFPTSAFIVISTIGWVIDPPATCINVCGDAASAMLIDKCVNKKE